MFLIRRDEQGKPEELYAALATGEESSRQEALDALLAEGGREEFLHVEFKPAPKDPAKPDDFIRAQYGKAVSAFANADGGIVVWGVEAPDDPARRAPYGVRVTSVQDAKAFRDWLHRSRKEVCHPAVPDIQVAIVTSYEHEGKKCDVVVTYVGKSWLAPHMAHMGEEAKGRYWRRGSDATRRMDAYEVEDLFGRRSGPNLSPEVVLSKQCINESTWPNISLVWDLWNEGRSMAILVCLELRARLVYGEALDKVYPATECGLRMATVKGQPEYVKLGETGAMYEGHYLWSGYIPFDGPPIPRKAYRKVAMLQVPLEEIREAVAERGQLPVALRFEWTAAAQDMRPRTGELQLRFPNYLSLTHPLFVRQPGRPLRLRLEPRQMYRYLIAALDWKADHKKWAR